MRIDVVSHEPERKAICNQLMRVIGDLTITQTEALLEEAKRLAGASNGHAENSHSAALESLSARELEVLVLVAHGYNRKNIGESLGISINTAARHIANIYRKLEVSSVAEATGFAYSSLLIGDRAFNRVQSHLL